MSMTLAEAQEAELAARRAAQHAHDAWLKLQMAKDAAEACTRSIIEQEKQARLSALVPIATRVQKWAGWSGGTCYVTPTVVPYNVGPVSLSAHLEAPDAEPIVALIDMALLKLPEDARSPYAEDYGFGGTTTFTFKQHKRRHSKTYDDLSYFDHNGDPCPTVQIKANITPVRIGFQVFEYDFMAPAGRVTGVSLRLLGVQVMDANVVSAERNRLRLEEEKEAAERAVRKADEARRKGGLLTIFEIAQDTEPRPVAEITERIREARQVLDPKLATPYLLNGHAVAITLVTADARYSYLIAKPRKRKWSERVSFYVDLLTDTSGSRIPVGTITGKWPTEAVNFQPATDTQHTDAAQLFARVFTSLITTDTAPDGVELLRESRCEICGARLTDGKSVAASHGPVCRKKLLERVLLKPEAKP